MNRMITIPITMLHPHPDNPRKDLGDLTELADSIREQGILQNLTVVQGHYEDGEHVDGDYTVIIGHRRLAAAKEAELETVPAVITDMTYEEQIATMLTENIQRSDLTLYEEAQSFNQLSVMGWKTEDIARKTGVSKSKVGKRLRVAKVAELNNEGMKEAVGRGATLEDILEIEKIKDPEAQENLFQYLGTRDFQNKLRMAQEREIFEKAKSDWIEILEKAGAEQVEGQTGKYVGALYSWNAKAGAKPPLKEDRKYAYVVSETSVNVYDVTEEDTDEEAQKLHEKIMAKARERDRQLAELQSITQRHYELRTDFVHKADFNESVKAEQIFGYYAATAILFPGYYRSPTEISNELKEAFKIEKPSKSFGEDIVGTFAGDPRKLAAVMFLTACDSGASTYYKRNWNDREHPFEYYVNPRLDYVYHVLGLLGYEMSEEEKMMQEGRHPYLQPDNEEEE